MPTADPVKCDVVVVGGGFAGIFAAWRLAHAGQSVVLVDKADHLGGTLWSRAWKDYFVDTGTHNFDLRGHPSKAFIRTS